MKILRYILIICLLFDAVSFYASGKEEFTTAKIFVEWQDEKPSGTIEVLNGSLEKITLIKGKGHSMEKHFEFNAAGQNRIEISLRDVNTGPGSGTTLISIHTGSNSFSFFLRDVSAEYPIWIPQYS